VIPLYEATPKLEEDKSEILKSLLSIYLSFVIFLSFLVVLSCGRVGIGDT